MALLKDIAAGNISGMAPTPVESYAISNYLVNDGLFNLMEFVPTGMGMGNGNIATSVIRYSEEAGIDAAFRGIGNEYDVVDATPEPKTVYLKNLGGAYHVDRTTTRALKNDGIDVWREQQASQKANRIKNGFAKYFLSGDIDVNPNGFNGVYKEVFAELPELEVASPFDLVIGLNPSNALGLEQHFNDCISNMNVNPNAVITTRKGAALAKTLNAHRNYGTGAVEIGDLKYNQLMGIPIVQVEDSYFPDSRASLGIGFVFVYIADDEKGIKTGIPIDGKVIDIVEPELGDGTLVKTGAMEMIAAPLFQNLRGASVCYVRVSNRIGSLTVGSVAGTESGDTLISVTEDKVFDTNVYKYKTADSVALPSYDDALTGYSDWDGSADITATTDDELVVVELTADGDILKAGKVTVVSAE